MAQSFFHPVTQSWFAKHFSHATEVQAQAWQAIGEGEHTLIAAPTGSGKTLAGFLGAIDMLVREGVERGLPQQTRVLYISPLKALSHDIQINLQQPLNGIRDELLHAGLADVPIQAQVRTGDTSQAERERMRRYPPHILVTTPESLYLLLSSESGRAMLQTVQSVIVDEIHALANNKRGAHLTLSLERLAALVRHQGGCDPQRIGLSATQKPIEAIAHYLTGDRPGACRIIDAGHRRQRDLALEVPESPLDAVMANEVWEEIYRRLIQLVEQHRTTLIFVNTRRLAERVAHHLAQILGEDQVTSHHGSLARKHRLHAEQRLKHGQLRALVCTASLELGIDIGDVELVCQLGSPRAIATFLQRVGRSGHSVRGEPKGRLFPLTRDELVECAALLEAIQQGELDRIPIPAHPLDVLSQQIVAEVASQEWDEDALFHHFTRAWPYRELSREDFEATLRMLAEGYSTRRGRRGAYLHRDRINRRLRGRRGARLVALTNGGAIPDQFDYDVVLQPEGLFIGTLNEDFAFESLPGDIFQLGNQSYRMLKIEKSKVLVEDAHGQPPNIPFWFGEAPGRTDELSVAVSDLLHQFDTEQPDAEGLAQRYNLARPAAEQLSTYLAAAKHNLGNLPHQGHLVFERFYDETGDMHLVIHSPYGTRLNRAWGLALRKRFCRKFNFELQAAANDNNIVLSLGPTHSFALDEVVRYLNAGNIQDVLVQALLDAPMFTTRWRWNANIALAVQRNRNGKRLPAQFQRSDAEDLIAVVFPDQLACLENIAGAREIPDHPLVKQTLDDCLNEAMDVQGLIALYQRIERGEVTVTCRDLPAPSPLADEILNARPYAFLDDAPAEERRTHNVQQQALHDVMQQAGRGALDPQAIARVREELKPVAANADELHEITVLMGFIGQQDMHEHGRSAWPALLDELLQQGRITAMQLDASRHLWVAAERLHLFQQAFPGYDVAPDIPAICTGEEDVDDPSAALREIVRARLEHLGPVTVKALADSLGVNTSAVQQALAQLEQEGFVLQGHFEPGVEQVQWCERRLLARIHRYSLKRRRSEVRPVSPQAYMRFVLHWQHLDEPREGEQALAEVIDQLQGCALPAASWEEDILAARLSHYDPQHLDNLCMRGQVRWLRPRVQLKGNADTAQAKTRRTPATVKNTPLMLLPRSSVGYWHSPEETQTGYTLSAHGRHMYDTLNQHGALFFDELQQAVDLLPVQCEQTLTELVSAGLVTCDGFAGLRALITSQRQGRHRRRRNAYSLEQAGRWSLVKPALSPRDEAGDPLEHIVRVLLKRYGVIVRKLLERETQLPPWRRLLYTLHRMEARGEILGGRFIDGFAGEQFALPEAATALRQMAQRPVSDHLISVAATDPLNLTAVLTPGRRVPALRTHRILFRDGVPIGYSKRDHVHFFDEIDASDEWQARNTLLRKQRPLHYHAAEKTHLQ